MQFRPQALRERMQIWTENDHCRHARCRASYPRVAAQPRLSGDVDTIPKQKAAVSCLFDLQQRGERREGSCPRLRIMEQKRLGCDYVRAWFGADHQPRIQSCPWKQDDWI